MTDLLADYSTARPSYDQLRANGIKGMIRYLCDDACEASMPGKRITLQELQSARAAGFAVALVWENGAQDARGGDSAGAYAASWINKLTAELGWPSGLPVYGAVDYNAPQSDWPEIAAYLNRIHWDTGRPGAMYGMRSLGEQMIHDGHITYLWQSYAWSTQYDPIRSPQARLFQRYGSPIPGTDIDEILNVDCGLWTPDGWNGTPTAPPPPPPPPAPPMTMWQYWRSRHWGWRWGWR